MNLEELIDTGWQKHATDPHSVAQLLQAHQHLVGNAEQAGNFLRLSNHTIGEHLQDWPQAHALAQSVLAQVPQTTDATNALISLAVAQWLAGDTTAALVTQTRVVTLNPTQPTASLARMTAQIVSGLIANDRVEEGCELYRALLDMASAAGDGSIDRVLAVTSNNVASEMLEKATLNPPETALMLDAAAAALACWRRCGTWMHEERALYLLALVHNKIGQADIALGHAHAALALIRGNRAQASEETVDEAFLELALAHAYQLTGAAQTSAAHLNQADALASAFVDEGLQQWFATERARLPSA
ncbi:hypothetical protein [Silvimonas sp.]|uniref:hypothetical protein n=1 Tax=Silvimonas sp. TaxID=2650811 RepID=UPI002847898C|nr:hypothetical protein [Silvimonas sp.]MDR3427445.1 hypothetical protein [Silvimonas sp.]